MTLETLETSLGPNFISYSAVLHLAVSVRRRWTDAQPSTQFRAGARRRESRPTDRALLAICLICAALERAGSAAGGLSEDWLFAVCRAARLTLGQQLPLGAALAQSAAPAPKAEAVSARVILSAMSRREVKPAEVAPIESSTGTLAKKP